MAVADFYKSNGAELVDSYLIKNRAGQQYFTPEIPSIDNYKLVMDKLPENGAGKVAEKETVVTYRYTKVTDDTDKSVCTVNMIYMDDTGKVIEKKTVTGKEGEDYLAPENEYEEMTHIEVPKNVSGRFKKGEINILFCYSTQPDLLADMLVYIYIGTGVILALCIASAIISKISRKKKLMANIDIVE